MATKAAGEGATGRRRVAGQGMRRPTRRRRWAEWRRRLADGFRSPPSAATATALLTAIAAIGALYFTAQQSAATQVQIAQAEQGQVTSRYTSAIEQLGNESLQVRLGGIYALERLAHDSPSDQSTIVEVLSAYLRGKFPPGTAPECSAPPAPTSVNGAALLRVPLASDVRAAMSVLGRRETIKDGPARVDLSDACLSTLTPTDFRLLDPRPSALIDALGQPPGPMDSANLERTNLSRADLTGVTWSHPRLAGADLRGTILTSALLRQADLKDADLRQANLDRADMDGADFTASDLSGASMGSSSFSNASFRLAILNDAVLSGADLRGVDLQGALLRGADLQDASLGGARVYEPDFAFTRNADLAGAAKEPYGLSR